MLLTLAAWIHLMETPSRRRGLIAGVLWAITGFFYWFYAWFVAVALVCLVGAQWAAKRAIPWRSIALGAGVAALAILPWAWLFASGWSDIPGTAEAFPPSHAAQDSVWPSLPFFHRNGSDPGAMSAVLWLLGLVGAFWVVAVHKIYRQGRIAEGKEGYLFRRVSVSEVGRTKSAFSCENS